MSENKYVVRNSDNKIFNSVQDAVKDIMCPGPCDDGLCPLHRQVLLSDNTWGHMCHMDYVAKHPATVMVALDLRPATDLEVQALTGNQPDSNVPPVLNLRPAENYDIEAATQDIPGRYIALIASSAVRDVQVCNDENPEPLSDNWYDYEGAEIYIGLYENMTALEARKTAAEFANTHMSNIRLIPV